MLTSVHNHFRNICLEDKNIMNPNFSKNDREECAGQELSLGSDKQLYVIIALWTLLVLSVAEGILEKFTNLPMPFKKFQETKENIATPNMNRSNVVDNVLYDVSATPVNP